MWRCVPSGARSRDRIVESGRTSLIVPESRRRPQDPDARTAVERRLVQAEAADSRARPKAHNAAASKAMNSLNCSP